MRFLLIFIASLIVSSSVLASEPQVLAIVAAKDVMAKNLSQRELMLIYKKKLTMWENGQRIQPANLPPDHPARRQFSYAILKSLPDAQASYWNDMYYHGVSPPHVLSSPEVVLRFVADTKGAIAYLPACLADERIKTLLWIDESNVVSSTKPEFNCP